MNSPLPVPPKHLRKCGAKFQADDYFLKTANAEATRILTYTEALDSSDDSSPSQVLDIGCGVGRLPLGLKDQGYKGRYTGFDLDRKALAWCDRQLADNAYQFLHMDIQHDRYNPRGKVRMDDTFLVPLPDGCCDVIYLYSVFTHLEEDAVKLYLKEFRRLLAQNDNAFVFLTAFLEHDVPDMAVNPPDYPPHYLNKAMGPLHRVRYNQDTFVRWVDEAGLVVDSIGDQDEWNCQSSVYLRHL